MCEENPLIIYCSSMHLCYCTDIWSLIYLTVKLYLISYHHSQSFSVCQCNSDKNLNHCICLWSQGFRGFGHKSRGFAAPQCTHHEFHENCHSTRYILFHEKKTTPNDALTPQCLSQFTPKMKANCGSGFSFIFGVNRPLQSM